MPLEAKLMNRSCQRHKQRAQHSGFSLIEVLIALAIFLGSLTTIAWFLDIAAQSSLEARKLTAAMLLCETKMEETLAGIYPLESTSNQSFEDNAEWNWSMDVSDGPVSGLLSVTIEITSSETPTAIPVFSLNRWMRDPETLTELIVDAETALEEEEEEENSPQEDTS